jgi:hypothetical protein
MIFEQKLLNLFSWMIKVSGANRQCIREMAMYGLTLFDQETFRCIAEFLALIASVLIIPFQFLNFEEVIHAFVERISVEVLGSRHIISSRI